MYTTMYRIWVRPGREPMLEAVWLQQASMLKELGLASGWVVVRRGGECAAYLQWQHQQFWESVREYCHLMDEVARAMGDNMLGWLAEAPVSRT